MMPLNPQQLEEPSIFLTRLGLLLAEKARAHVRPRIPSRVLRRSLKIVPLRTSKNRYGGAVEIPHYWAVYYHDGHRAVRPKQKDFIVYFRKGKKALDPRIQVGAWYPRRIQEVKRLKKSEFYRELKKGNLVVTKRSGPAAGKKFFTDGMRSFEPIADKIVRAEVEKWINRTVNLGTRAERRGRAWSDITI